jgi:hypothetical protein
MSKVFKSIRKSIKKRFNIFNKPQDIDEIVKSNTNKQLNKIILGINDSFRINDIILKREGFALGEGQFKIGFKMKVESGIPGVEYAALVVSKPSFDMSNIGDIIKSYTLAKDSSIIPKLYTAYICDKGFCFLFEIIEGPTLCEVCENNQFDSQKQILLLDAYLSLGKMGVYQDDENCGNIIFGKDGVRIIDDLAQFTHKFYIRNLFVMLYCIFCLQLIEGSELYNFLGRWLSNNAKYDTDKLFDNETDFKSLPIGENDDIFESKINNWTPNLLKQGGKRNKKNKTKKTKLKNKTTKI